MPVARQLAEDLLDPADAMDRSVKAATDPLASCYDCLSQHAPFAEERLATHCRKFCALKVALEAGFFALFSVRKKCGGRPAGSCWSRRALKLMDAGGL